MQSLKSLTVYENADEAQPAIDTTELQFSDTFSSLTCFSIETISFEGVTSLLDACQPRTLHEIFVTSPGVEDGGAFSGLLAVASSVCLELKKIFVQSVDPEIPTAPQSNLSKEFFSVLYRCTNLTSLTLYNTPPLHLNIEILSDLLKGLPSLRTLRLSEYSGTKPTLPLACLPKLTPLCPQMVKLELYMNTSSVPDAKSPHQNDLECFKRLEHLDVGRSPLKSSSLRVTSFLSSVLPVGCHLLHDSESSGQRHNTWMSVAEFLPMMIRMRRAERLLDARCGGCRSMK
ncbi:hypothetical protein BDN71DRAFT_1495570 [Pleurotus eryngii]|uniref:Uncharacterized protein n=1 Tax=Pleurotus eryngii TaxID=5323 RepID=A0A9P6D7L8_PLEER|nr:hypothetical protein BDN71DRAFT_1495570 [Pleurotus eryngii]